MKIVTVLGARPQFIKSAPVSRALKSVPGMQEIIVHTGQHFDPAMSQVFFDEMKLDSPKYNLGIHSLNHGAMTGRMLEKIESILLDEKPDWVVVYGDTNSTLAGSLAAKKLHVKLAHVEAGLRSFNMMMPEEINRIVADRLSDLLFCPTPTSIKNLEKEGYGSFSCSILHTGDVMLDACMMFTPLARQTNSKLTENLPAEFIVCTLHRAENTNDPVRLKEIFKALDEIHRIIPVVMPLHPRTRQSLTAQDIKTSIQLVEPAGYLDMIRLLNRCSMVMTDSGGLQKEAYFFRKKCITLRHETEWTELVEAGCNIIAGNRIYDSFTEMKNRNCDFSQSFYGDGKASDRIVQALTEYSH